MEFQNVLQPRLVRRENQKAKSMDVIIIFYRNQRLKRRILLKQRRTMGIIMDYP
mgnify:CR=1 FL=1